jgi:AraC-like DNA-binding protein
MASPCHSAFASPAGLLPSGVLWRPAPALASCVWAYMVRNTVGQALQPAQRMNHFPASPLCSLTWWIEGEALTLLGGDDTPPRSPEAATPQALPSRWVLSGPQTRPGTSWNPGPVHSLTVVLMPEALQALTGLAPADLTDQFVDAHQALPSAWAALHGQVLAAPDDAARMQALEAALTPLWQACRPAALPAMHRMSDWVAHLAQRAATSNSGRSLRQLERRIKLWAGQPLRDLRVMGRSEQAFFDVAAAHLRGDVNWAELAVAAGYTDQAHFCRVTRRITGFSPEALRQGMLSGEAFWPYRLWL